VQQVRPDRLVADLEYELVLLSDLLDQLALLAQGDDFAVIDDPYPVAELLSFLHEVGGVEHGEALFVA
jgi:hypothetical protein